MKTVYKYEIKGNGCTLKLPVGACVLAVKEQGSAVYMWVSIDTEQTEKVERTFNIYGTGHAVPPDEVYVGTVFLLNGVLVFRVFEKIQGV